jgi:signal transduction histidine kinase/CheY-like chemotaxis protein
VGALDESVRSFLAALDASQDPVVRASILARIAWVRRARNEPELAWAALGEGFEALGARMPTGDAVAAASDTPRFQSVEALDVLYELHHQNARLALEAGIPLRTMQSTMQVLALAGSAGPSLALARTQATHGAMLVFFGRGAEGEERLERAQQMAARLGDPATVAFCLQRRATALAFVGDFDASLSLFTQCANEYGPWFEVTEFCSILATCDVVESVRGRAALAASWMQRAMDRLRRAMPTASAFAHEVLLRSRAGAAATGVDGRESDWLATRLASAGPSEAQSAFYRLRAWGPRARAMLDTGNLGPAFELLVRDFQADGRDPASGHLVLLEYYIAVAHARIHQCLRGSPDERRARVAELRSSAADLRAAAKVPLGLAHSRLVDGTIAWLDGDLPTAHRLLVEADALASSETCPWVSWGVARIRAYMLREKAKLDAASDQARVAEMLARVHGAEPRARWVRDEFGLPAPESNSQAASAASSSRRSSRRARRQLTSLLHLVAAPHGQLAPQQQALAIVDDLVRELGAERVFLRFAPASETKKVLVAGRNRLGETLAPPDEWRERLMREVTEPGSDMYESGPDLMATHGDTADRARTAALPLFILERIVGAILVERGPKDPAFTAEEHELLLVLSHQVPLALELSRLLAERDELQASMQQAQKMEVIGQLAGSVAHDFNNMLGVIHGALYALERNDTIDAEGRADVSAIGEATDRATNLATRLLAFSRQGKLTLGAVDINRAVKGVEPLFARIASPHSGIRVELELDPDVHPAFADESSLDQAIMNLVVNARDAMPRGGRLRICTRDIVLGPEDVRRGAPCEGEYVMVEVSDNGHGIPPDVLSRVYDPFFTTKPVGKGTGLGLTTVYSFVKQCGGHIDVETDVGVGTSFRLYFRRSEALRVEMRKSVPAPSVEPGKSPSMILVVDDDPAVRDVTRQLLEQGGYRVLTATGSAEAIRAAEVKGKEIALVIMDVHMPEMSGPELGQRLADLNLPAKVLFVSGAYDGEEDESPLRLQKPFSSADLLGRVRTLLHS